VRLCRPPSRIGRVCSKRATPSRPDTSISGWHRRLTVAHVPAEVAEAVQGVVRSGGGDCALEGSCEPSGEGGKHVDEGGRVEGGAECGSHDVSEEDGVEC
jgi:hypothetical protein